MRPSKKTTFFKITGIVFFASCMLPLSAFAREWGKIMTAPADTTILAERNSRAKVAAKLKAGHKVKADFLEAGWYAVFRLDEKVRSKKKALGYVAARNLKPVNKPSPPKADTAGAKPVFDQSLPPKEIPAGTRFVVDLTAQPKTGAAGAKAASKPPAPSQTSAPAGKDAGGGDRRSTAAARAGRQS